MIKDEQQYQRTKVWIEEFTRTLDYLDTHSDEGTPGHPLLRKAERDGLVSQIQTLQQEICGYEALQG